MLTYLTGNNVFGDTITLDNGDVLHGELIGLSGKVITFKTEYAGMLYINQRKVESLATEAVFTIVYVDGSKETKAVSKDLEVDKFDIVRSARSRPLAMMTAWKSQITLSLAGTSGNSQSQNFSLFGESSLLRSKSEQLLNVAQTLEKTDGLTTTDLLDVKYNFRWLRENQWYNSMSVDYSYDPLQDTASRSVLGFGGGKKFVDHSLTNMSVDVAVSAVYQSVDELEEISPAIRIGSVFHKKLFGGRIEVLQQNRLLWITEVNSGVIDGLLGFRLLLSDSLNLDFRSNVKHETNSTENAKNTDLTYSFGVGVSF